MSGAATGLAVAAALGSAAAFGLATAMQHAEAGEVQRRGAFHPGLIGSLAVRRGWLLSFIAEFAAIGLQGLALRDGRVALVQALIVFGLPVAVVLSTLLGARKLSGRDILGLGLCTAGLVACAVPQPPGAGTQTLPPLGRALWAAAVCGALVVALTVLAVRRPRLAGAASGAAAGVVIGMSVPVLAVVAAGLDDPVELLSSWPPYALAVLGLLGLTLSQAAFQTGSLGAPLATLTLTEPVTAVALAVAVLHQRLPEGTGPRLAILTGALVAAGGVLLLAAGAEPAHSAVEDRL